MAPQYKITYGDFRGLGEPARMILAYADIPFEDERLKDFANDVEKIRHQLPYGQVPLLTIDGTTTLGQSHAIYRLLARRYGLAGAGDLDQARVDGYADFLSDLTNNTRPFFLVKLGRKQGDLVQLEKEASEYVTKWTKFLDKTLAASGSGFFHKSGVTWPDFIAANFYWTAKNVGWEAAANVKGLQTIAANVAALPQLKEYLSKRKDTPF